VFLIAGMVFVVIVERNHLYKKISEIYPTDPARSTALDRCSHDDQLFNGFSAEDRAACYRKWLIPSVAPGSNRVALRVPNAVDLKRAAGQSVGGAIAQDDIRSRQAADFYHPN
jgi:hypothetical protein